MTILQKNITRIAGLLIILQLGGCAAAAGLPIIEATIGVGVAELAYPGTIKGVVDSLRGEKPNEKVTPITTTNQAPAVVIKNGLPQILPVGKKQICSDVHPCSPDENLLGTL